MLGTNIQCLYPASVTCWVTLPDVLHRQIQTEKLGIA